MGPEGAWGSMSVSAQPFISMMTGTFDKKGRVCIPAPYRPILAAQNTNGVYVCPSFHEPALECFGDEVLQQFHLAQSQKDPFFAQDQDDRAFAVLAMTQLLPLDENGRVRIPDELIAHAGLKETVTFIGMGRKFEIWDRERFAPVFSERINRARALRAPAKPAEGEA